MIRRRRPQRIVFVGRRNDARRQMAEGLARRRFDPTQFIFRSAGVSPTRLNPWAVLVMDEVGVDIAGAQATVLESIVASNVDALVFVEPDLKAPPRFPGIRRIDWRIDDPTPSRSRPTPRCETSGPRATSSPRASRGWACPTIQRRRRGILPSPVAGSSRNTGALPGRSRSLSPQGPTCPSRCLLAPMRTSRSCGRGRRRFGRDQRQGNRV